MFRTFRLFPEVGERGGVSAAFHRVAMLDSNQAAERVAALVERLCPNHGVPTAMLSAAIDASRYWVAMYHPTKLPGVDLATRVAPLARDGPLAQFTFDSRRCIARTHYEAEIAWQWTNRIWMQRCRQQDLDSGKILPCDKEDMEAKWEQLAQHAEMKLSEAGRRLIPIIVAGWSQALGLSSSSSSAFDLQLERIYQVSSHERVRNEYTHIRLLEDISKSGLVQSAAASSPISTSPPTRKVGVAREFLDQVYNRRSTSAGSDSAGLEDVLRFVKATGTTEDAVDPKGHAQFVVKQLQDCPLMPNEELPTTVEGTHARHLRIWKSRAWSLGYLHWLLVQHIKQAPSTLRARVAEMFSD